MIKLDIEANALDSFDEAMIKIGLAQEGDNKAYKFAILHLSHAIELVLKMYLQTLDENLLFVKCFKKVKQRAFENKVDFQTAFRELQKEGFDFAELINDDRYPHTVTVGDVLTVVKHEKCSKSGANLVNQSFIDDINWMKNIRNAIEHFEFEFSPKELRLCIGRLVRGIDEFSDLFSLFSLREKVSEESYNTYSVLVDEYEHQMAEALIDIKEAREKAYKGYRPKEWGLVQWEELICDSCGNRTMIENEESSSGYKCAFCGEEESGEIPCCCDSCGDIWTTDEMHTFLDEKICPRCLNPENY